MTGMMHKLKSLLVGDADGGGIETEPGRHAPKSALTLEAERRLADNKPGEALKLAYQSLAADRSSYGQHYLLGRCLDRIGRHDEALAEYQLEVSNHPGHTEARQRVDALSRALAKPAPDRRVSDQRPWPTSLPRETLARIQQAVHSYTYRGVRLQKNPFDFALYPMLLWALKPSTIFEIGSNAGGSALWFGDVLNAFGIAGHVYSLDIVRVDSLAHPRVTFLEGDGRALGKSLNDDMLTSLPRPWLVIEDADHAYETSIAVLRFFHPRLRPGEFIVIEDGIISDLSGDPACNSGPHRALKEFLSAHPAAYEIAPEYCDFFGHNVTWCTNGFLRRR